VCLGRFLWCALTLPMAFAMPLKASEHCPPPTYEKCPNGFRQSWPIPPLPAYIDTDTVVEEVENGLWEYHWCLKSTVPVEDEIFFIWGDLGWSGGTTDCGGFWGQNLRASYPPSDPRRTRLVVGPNLEEIRPDIQLPADRIPPPPLPLRALEYLNTLFGFLSLDKTGENLTPVELAIRSIATPVILDNEHVATRYELEYVNAAQHGSPLRFFLGESLADRSEDLDRLFSLSEKPQSFEFTEEGPPTNVIGTLVFVGPDDYEVGSMPVSLAVPSK